MPGNSEPIPFKDNEVDLFDLAVVLWARKWLIVTISLGFFFAGLLCVLVAPSTYEASANLTPPDEALLLRQNILNRVLERDPVSPQHAFSLGLTQLATVETQDKVFKAQREGFTGGNAALDDDLEEFREAVQVKAGDSSATLSFQNSNNEYARTVVKALIAQANADAATALNESTRQSLETLIQLNQIKLDQAEAIRHSSKQTEAGNNFDYLDNAIAEAQLALSTYRVYKDQDYTPLSMLQLDTDVALPTEPVRPNKARVLALCLIIGFVIGIFVALVSYAKVQRGR